MDVFNDLGKDNNGLVAYDKLQETLISTGKFYADHTVLMIEHIEKIGENRRDSFFPDFAITKDVRVQSFEGLYTILFCLL